jgi:nucleoid DNA-binding protein
MTRNYVSANGLATIIAGKHRMSKKEGRHVVDLIFSSITHALKDGREIWIPTFGKFYADQKPQRPVMNPRTGRVQIGKPKVIPHIRFSGVLKGMLNSPAAV